MTPEPKKRIFDEEKFWDLISSVEEMDDGDDYGVRNESGVKQIESFVEQEMRRFAREMLEKAKQKDLPDQRENNPAYWFGVDDMNFKIDALIKKLE